MRRSDLFGLVLLLVLGLAAAAYATRIADHYQAGGRFQSEWGRAQLTTLLPATRTRLENLPIRVSATYYVSGREHMPSHMRRIERRVTDLLEIMHRAAPDRFDYQIVDPENEPELTSFAANRRIAPFRQRSVTRDAYSERTIWSALALSYGTRPEAVINGITPEVLPRLQRTIVAHLDQLESPREPVFALATGGGAPFEELAQALADRGRLERVSLDRGDPFPVDADVLFWMAPRDASAQRLVELDRFLASGRSAVIAGGSFAVDGRLRSEADGPALVLRESGYATPILWSHLGLLPVQGLFCDERGDEVVFEGESVRAPFAIRCIAPNQNFRSLARQPNGTLLFAVPTPLAIDGETLSRRGWRAKVLATTSDKTWRLDAPVGHPLGLARMDEQKDQLVPKQALITALEADDPWKGRVVALAATTPFEDGLLNRSFNAHVPLLDTLCGDLASDDRLVIADAPSEAPSPIPALSRTARTAWRLAGVFLIPALLMVLFFVLRARGNDGFRRDGADARRIALLPIVLVIGAVTLAATLRATPWRWDVSQDRSSRLADATRDLARRAGERGPVQVTLAFTERSNLPPAWRTRVDRLGRLTKDLERAGASLEVTRVDPADLTDNARAELEERGAVSLEVVSRREEETIVRRIYATILLADGESETSVSFDEERAFEEAEFRLAFALWRLENGRTPHIGFASDVPRLSAAEAHEDYQQKGLFAPSGVDVYSRARKLLTASGYRVTHVNPREPEFPDDLDLLIWMQPRRSIEPMMQSFARYLHGGGSVLLAAQHFNIQSRQYRGAGFDLVYWPQPQSPDIDRIYFPEIGIRLVREVLFDSLSTEIETDTQITGRGATRDFERQTSTLPFLVRASAANFDPDSPITRNLGDQAFAWPSHLEWDSDRLAALGIEATPILSTSSRSWTFDWKGGWIPNELLAGPAEGADGTPAWRSKLPIAALFEGHFPRPEAPMQLDPDAERNFEDLPWPASSRGRLLFLGTSEPFKDASLDHPVFRSDHLLKGAAATLALPPELAGVATKRPAKRGFGLVEPETRLAWRASVLGSGPLAILLFAGLWAYGRSRRTRIPERAKPAA